MLETTLLGLLKARFPDAKIDLQMEGNHCHLTIIDAEFDGMRAVKRQQQVYAELNAQIASGEVHAVHMTLQTPAESAA